MAQEYDEAQHSTENVFKRFFLRHLFFTRWKIWNDAKFLLFCLCIAGIVQGMIFTNVVISSIERRFGYDSTQSGIIAGSYDIGSLLAVVPVTYFGGRPNGSKPKVIALGMAVIGLGSLIFSLPHFTTSRYVDLIAVPFFDNNATRINQISKVEMMDEFTTNRICKYEPQTPIEDNSRGVFCNEHNRNEKISSASELHNYKYVFILAQLLHGIGASAIITLGTTLLDESVRKKTASMYIGIFQTSFVLGPAIGYVVGGRLLSIFTEFYLTDDVSLHLIATLTPTSPQWVGAWWLGFALIVFMSFFCCILLSFFPAKMSPVAEKECLQQITKKGGESAIENNNNNLDDTHINRCDYGSLKDLPTAFLSLLKNKTFMSISIGAALDAFILAGKAAFLPKYLEYQFGLTSGQSAMLVGAIIVPAGAGGSLLGGYLPKRFNMGRKKCLQFYVACQFIILPLYLGFLFNCPTQPYSGININRSTDSLELSTSCNQACQCKVDGVPEEPHAVTSPFYEPVCHLPSGTNFFSACLAGCTDFTLSGQTNITVFHHCSCVPLPGSDGITSVTDDVIPGTCPSECSYILFSVLLFFNVLFTFVATMPGLVASLRSVEHNLRSLSMGLQMIFIRGLGTVPGPIVFGYVIDQTCLMWQTTVRKKDTCSLDETDDASISKGSCRLYDNVPMSINVMAIAMAWRFAGTIFFVLALYFDKYCKIKDTENAKEDEKPRSEKSNSNETV